jgi:hypothetical protein
VRLNRAQNSRRVDPPLGILHAKPAAPTPKVEPQNDEPVDGEPNQGSSWAAKLILLALWAVTHTCGGGSE